MIFSLNGKWKVLHFPYGSDISPVLSADFIPEGWLTADIPEDIHATLRRSGAIRGNTFDKREAEDAWIEQKDWVYYKAFFAPDSLREKSVTLYFEGLDTFCDIYLNGEKLGSHRNMHTPWEAEIGQRLRHGERNALVVRFYSPTAFVADMDQRGDLLHHHQRPDLRPESADELFLGLLRPLRHHGHLEERVDPHPRRAGDRQLFPVHWRAARGGRHKSGWRLRCAHLAARPRKGAA